MDFISETSTEYLLSLRIVRIVIAPGIYENLITNLPDIEFDMDDLKELYHLRWAQENAYRDLKYPLCLKAFHSKKYTYIVQEVFSRAIRLSTFIALFSVRLRRSSLHILTASEKLT